MAATKPPPKAKVKSKKSNKKKLTLSLNEKVITLGKALAKEQGMSLSKLVEQFLQEQITPVREPVTVIEPDPDILALMGKPTTPLPEPKSNREYYDEYTRMRRERYLRNTEEE